MSTAQLRWRPGVAADVLPGLALPGADRGDDIVGSVAASALWRELVAQPSCVVAAIERAQADGRARLVGFGVSAFVRADFIDAEMAAPRPRLNSRLLAAIANGQSPLLDRDTIGLDNAGEGLNALAICSAWTEEGLNDDERAQVQLLLPFALAQLYAGYRLRRLFGEACGAGVELMRRSGIAVEIARWPALDRALNLVTREHGLAQPMSMAGLIFRTERPRVLFSESQQILLQAALQGQTDDELARTLGLSLAAIKARWRAIFARFGLGQLEFDAGADARTRRGPQKRHQVLAYVRAHPEELRPYAPAPTSHGHVR